MPMAEDNLSDRQRRLLGAMRAGKRTEIDDLITRLAKRAEGERVAALNDSGRSESWKAEQVEHIHASTLAMFDAELTKLAGPLADTHRRDYGAVFGTDGVPGDAASLAISRRDAGDRVASVGSTSGLLELLERADLSGDEILARAIAQKAYENADAKVLNRFIESRPALDEAATRLWKRRLNHDQEAGDLFTISMKLSQLKLGTGFTVR